MNLFLMFEKKLEEIANSLGYDHTTATTATSKILHETWTEYLKGIGIQIVCHWIMNSDLSIISDPLYTAGRWLVIPKDVEEKIEVLGLP